MEKALVSVIVPVYNVEKYLHRCVDSILAQTLRDLELILVDDGSPDKCGVICDEYANKDNRVKVVHKENGGVSSARNAGINIAMGRWLCFVDSDDYIEETYLKDFNIINDSNIELYFQGYTLIDGELKNKDIHVFNSVNNDLSSVLADAEDKYIMNSPCFKLFSKDIVVQNNLLFDTKISYGEDHLFSLNYFYCINNVSINLTSGYINVRNGNESLTQRTVPLREILYYIERSRYLHESIIKKHHINNKDTLAAIHNRFVKNIKKAFNDILKRGGDSLELRGLKVYLRSCKFKCSNASKKNRFFITLLKYVPVRTVIFVYRRWVNM